LPTFTGGTLYLKTQRVKKLFITTAIALSAAACGTVKPAAQKPVAASSSQKQSSLTFINNVSLYPEAHRDKTGASSTTSNQQEGLSTVSTSYHPSSIENYSLLQFKYAILMDATVEEMNNQKLLNFIEEWYGTRYRYGGSSKDGIDCSAFVASMMSTVYGINNMPRISKDQYDASRHVRRNELQEGDLVFFHTMGKHKAVTHVGMYLRNNKFIHASISGVMISSLEDGYYAQHFVGAGRVVN
jgi:cell wall-associated NlpC family hydrolase